MSLAHGSFTEVMSGTWEKLKVVGKGGSSVVYKGRRVPSGDLIAIKEVRTDGLSEEQVKGFLTEVDTIKDLAHKNIIRYLGTEMAAGCFYIFLDYADRGSLRQFYVRNGALRESQAANTTRQVLKGLAYLHGNGIAHRDVKGANVLLCSNGVMKLADFGASKRFETESVVSGLKGTPQWMAPEVIRGDALTTGWSAADVWSVGCTVAEMVTANVPFCEFDNPMTAMYHIAKGMAPPIEGGGVEAAELHDIRDFVALCCSAAPGDRPTAVALLGHSFIKKASRKHRQKLDFERTMTVSMGTGASATTQRKGVFVGDTAGSSSGRSSSSRPADQQQETPAPTEVGKQTLLELAQTAQAAAPAAPSQEAGTPPRDTPCRAPTLSPPSSASVPRSDTPTPNISAQVGGDANLRTPQPTRRYQDLVRTPGSSGGAGPLRYTGAHMTPDIATIAESPEVAHNSAFDGATGTRAAAAAAAAADYAGDTHGSNASSMYASINMSVISDDGSPFGLGGSPISPTKPSGSPSKPAGSSGGRPVAHRARPNSEAAMLPSSSPPSAEVTQGGSAGAASCGRAVSPRATTFSSTARRLRMRDAADPVVAAAAVAGGGGGGIERDTGTGPSGRGGGGVGPGECLLASPPGQVRHFFSRDEGEEEDDDDRGRERSRSSDYSADGSDYGDEENEQPIPLDFDTSGIDNGRVEYVPAQSAPSPIKAPEGRPRPKAAVRGTRNKSPVPAATTVRDTSVSASAHAPVPSSSSKSPHTHRSSGGSSGVGVGGCAGRKPAAGERDLVLLAARAAPLLPHSSSPLGRANCLGQGQHQHQQLHEAGGRGRVVSPKPTAMIMGAGAGLSMDMGMASDESRPSGPAYGRRQGGERAMRGPAAVRQQALAALDGGDEGSELDTSYQYQYQHHHPDPQRALMRPRPNNVGGTGQKLRPGQSVRSRSAHVAGSRLPPMVGGGGIMSRSVAVAAAGVDGLAAQDPGELTGDVLGLPGQPRRNIKTAPALSRSVNLPPLEAIEPEMDAHTHLSRVPAAIERAAAASTPAHSSPAPTIKRQISL